jgi:hypothetical protein
MEASFSNPRFHARAVAAFRCGRSRRLAQCCHGKTGYDIGDGNQVHAVGRVLQIFEELFGRRG